MLAVPIFIQINKIVVPVSLYYLRKENLCSFWAVLAVPIFILALLGLCPKCCVMLAVPKFKHSIKAKLHHTFFLFYFALF
jgi:hypothetical protein